MSTVRELRERQEKLASEARSILDRITPDLDEGRQAELNQQADKAFAEFDKLEERINREERAAEMAARLNAPDPRRPVGDARSVSTRPQTGETVETAFRSYLLHGDNRLTSEQRQLLMPSQLEGRAQNIGTPSAGGYTVPVTLSNELVVSLKDYSPMLDPGVTREIVTERGERINWATIDDTAAKATIIGENTEVQPGSNAPGDLTFGQKYIGAFKYTSGLIKVSMELAQDSVLNMEAEIRRAFAERIGRGVGEHMTIGAGTTQPWGIVTRSAEGVEVALDSGNVANIDFDDLMELEHSVDPAYRRDPSCAWMLNDMTLKRLRKIKDLEGNYIWQPAQFATSAPATISGYRYVINQAMADVGIQEKSVLFGAMNRYIVRRVRELAILRLAERYAEFGQIAFVGFARFDGELVDTAAVKHLIHEDS